MSIYNKLNEVEEIINNGTIDVSLVSAPATLTTNSTIVDVNFTTTQTENLKVDLAAQTVGDINVDINSQTLSNVSTNVSQIAGSAINTGTGTMVGTQRVTIASDNNDIPIKNGVGGDISVDINTQTLANLNMNIKQIDTNTVTVENGFVGPGTQRVVLASDQPKVRVVPPENDDDSPFLAGSRLRVSNLHQVFSARWDNTNVTDTFNWDSSETTGTGYSHNGLANKGQLISGANSTGNATIQSYHRINGWSNNTIMRMNIEPTTVLSFGSTDDEITWGIFDANNGFYFSLLGDNTTTSLRVRVTLSSSDAVTVAQPSWNIDSLDGTGPSGFNIVHNRFNNYVIEYSQFRVRWGVIGNGELIYCHQHNIDNQSTATLFPAHLNLPVRIRNEGVNPNSSTFTLICSVDVYQEQFKSSFTRFHHSQYTTNSPLACSVNTAYGLIGLRYKASTGHERPVKITAYDSNTEGTADEWISFLWLNPTVAGSPVFANYSSNSVVQVVASPVVGNTVTLSSGVKLYAQSCSSAGSTNRNIRENLNVWLREGDEIWLVVRLYDSPVDIFGSIEWEEG